MYYLVMEMVRGQIRLDRIEDEMGRRGLDGKRLASAAHVSAAAISKLTSNKSPGMSAVNLASIAEALMVSVDYLLGLTNNPVRQDDEGITKELASLISITRMLPTSRQRDLLQIAQAFEDTAEETQREADLRLFDRLMDLADKAGQGDEIDDHLLKRLRKLLSDGPNGNPSSSDNDKEDKDDDAGGDDEPSQNGL